MVPQLRLTIQDMCSQHDVCMTTIYTAAFVGAGYGILEYGLVVGNLNEMLFPFFIAGPFICIQMKEILTES